MKHIQYMERALELAKKGIQEVSPNPAVGALLVKDGTIIGEGYHRGSGTLHAEIKAINSAGVSVEGATLYSTLEPCSTKYAGKKQAPCVERIIQEKISSVIISSLDPNPHVNGKGVEMLEKAGIHVITGVLDEENKILNEVYIKNMSQSLPFVHIKIAQTIDGKIATGLRDSKWITDEKAREDVHELRSCYDSILVGSGTVKYDDPLLTVRTVNRKSIKRLVVNSDLDIPLTHRIFENQNENPTMVITDKSVSMERQIPYKSRAIEILQIPSREKKRIDLTILMRELYAEGIRSVLVEGGSEIFTSFIKDKIFDKISFYIAPKICGSGMDSTKELEIEYMVDAIELKNVQIRTINNQVVMTGYRN
ncbi:MAG: bifunctional diaminohydroxyphosphoribosylaminopyrimidine deaminase/5-amino-6-(5-phosphoribosylamino)uracil reductase RibD [Spirochaetaceae bacterium]|nr:bifunctional diaminohydroxyphosphoribosylaminopyrimidine deaminase/5-amino-6-(5-phosphoribosylamino)uracil reductase RibD [Spirochaetaceae bacterium]